MYLAGKRWKSDGTRDLYAGHLRNHVIPAIGDVPMGSITAMRHIELTIAGWQQRARPEHRGHRLDDHPDRVPPGRRGRVPRSPCDRVMVSKPIRR